MRNALYCAGDSVDSPQGAAAIGDMDVPGFKLHSLKGSERGRWSVLVNGNWRLTFEFRDGQAYLLDYEDYH
jgi:plasmid maintenance system killer protein